MTASPLQWCCCGGSKFTRVTTDAIGIVYSCLVSNVTYISIGLVLSCTLFLIDTFISKVLVLSCTVYLINTVSYLSLVLSCTVSYLSLVLSCTLYLVCTVKTAITNKHYIVIESKSIIYQQNKVNSIIPALKVILDNIPLCCFLLPSTSYACHTLSAVTSVGSDQACLS